MKGSESPVKEHLPTHQQNTVKGQGWSLVNEILKREVSGGARGIRIPLGIKSKTKEW